MPRRLPIIAALAVLALALFAAACGGDGEETTTSAEETTSAQETTTTTTTPTTTTTTPGTTGEDETGGSCTAVEEVTVGDFGNHKDRDFTAADYETNPPAGGDHNPTPLQGGQFYSRPQPLGAAVHLLEHGAVIGWTNELDRTDQKAIEAQFNEVFGEGYYQLAVVENPELDVPFALSAWGFVQTCEQADPSAIAPFVEEHYAPQTSGESAIACQGEARRLPPCRAPQ